jgi:hypothetical protein
MSLIIAHAMIAADQLHARFIAKIKQTCLLKYAVIVMRLGVKMRA